MLKSYKWDGLDGMGWKSLKALILRAPLCGANKWRQLFRAKVRLRQKGEGGGILRGSSTPKQLSAEKYANSLKCMKLSNITFVPEP